ncbi:hypothetical protein M1D52_12460 [Olivibacter sp. SA151]|uniref:hypothetical protein n=1 Tax=Olivibacter jilunii TaxID=985016 RepID=UPI003F148A26
MKKLLFTAAVAAFIFIGCSNRQGDTNDGMGAGDGTDTLQEPMHPNDTSGMAAPVDTAMDTTSMP